MLGNKKILTLLVLTLIFVLSLAACREGGGGETDLTDDTSGIAESESLPVDSAASESSAVEEESTLVESTVEETASEETASEETATDVTATDVTATDVTATDVTLSEETEGEETEIPIDGTVGLKYSSYGNGTCIVSGMGSSTAQNVVIPTRSPEGDRVIGIASYAFEDCGSLFSVTFHDGIETVGVDSFYGCIGLSYNRYDNAYYLGSPENPYFLLVKAVSRDIESCEIPDETRIIYCGAFSGCTALKSVELPEGLKSIGPYAFAWCRSLKDVSIPDGVKRISEFAFFNCESLERLTLPTGLERLDDWAYGMCTGLESVYIPEQNGLKMIGHFAFYGCSSLSLCSFSGAKRLGEVGYASFAGCRSMVSIDFPEGMSKVGELAFLGSECEDVEALLQRINSDKAPASVTKDLPESFGVLNALLKARQLSVVSFYAINSIPQQEGDLEAGQYHAGLPYSSTRIENLFVPNCVSLYTFVTSAMNPMSKLYTVDLGELGNVNGDTYYGAVCSTYCAYALGIYGTYTTHQWKDIPGMEVLEDQSINALKIGDTVLGSGHVLMVSDIRRDAAGAVTRIKLMDIWITGTRERAYTPEDFTRAYTTEKYVYCRYGAIGDSQFTTEPLVQVYGKMPKSLNYNTELIPDRGDRSNYLAGDDVILDVLLPAGYTDVEIYRDGELIEVWGVLERLTLTLPEAGSYKARLTGSDGASDFCYFNVVDVRSSVTATEESGKVQVSFSALGASPKYIVWQNGYNHGSKHIQFLTEEEISLGSAVGEYISGEFKIRVGFENEYGIIFSALPEKICVP